MRLIAAFSLIGIVATPATAFELIKKTETTEKHSLNVPGVVGPAVNPYLWCRLQSLGATINGGDGKPVKKMAEKGGDCSALRTSAAVEADALLTKAGQSRIERTKMIDDTLKSVDDFAEEMRQSMTAAAAKWASEHSQ
jgi:hypothetical protein